jgi:hypothetical protein
MRAWRTGQAVRVETVVITADAPMLEGVFGPLSDHDDRSLRSALLACGARLSQVAQGFRSGPVEQAAAMKLRWSPSGQTAIESSVAATDSEGSAVTFNLELRPGWFYGDRTGEAGWVVEVLVEVDCQHSPDCGTMHQAFEHVGSAASLDEVIARVEEATSEVVRLAELPLADWVAMGRD